MSASKIGYLLIRTLAKPLANSIKVNILLRNYSKTHPTFRKWCISVAQKTYKFEMNLNMYLLGQKDYKIRSLNDAKAVDLGSHFLGESVIFGVTAMLIVWEQTRSRKQNKTLKEAVEKVKNELEENKIIIEKFKKYIEANENNNNDENT
ncbi:hypothetical protein Glove_55g50 [Diversispora epigaea]|uniref:Optic atrophy 3-like protein n=1 Tax=Diversispora epigaea TaxID=1348612 RepID=A0A397JDC3_9GLOM|nr:hypothetical protein Glove_55g50 [Diversispora epigaea]